ncbi:MAG: hypothetical protein CMH83_08755 [Nocardioides sp.]|nr:hypothetical protein [Nocardioides sp.]
MLHRVARHRAATVSTALVLALGLAACSTSGGADGPDDTVSSAAAADGGTTGDSVSDETSAPEPTKPVVTANVSKGSVVPVSTLVATEVADGSLTRVTLSSAAGTVDGTLAEDGSSWTAGDRLEPGTEYTLKAVAENDETTARKRVRFTTDALTLDDQTYASVAPLEGQTVGVGMPVIVRFDIPVTDKAAFEENMSVTATPQQAGTWHWLSDTEVHWRPKSYWQAGSEVTVDLDVNGVDAGNGIYGQESRTVHFTVGDANVYKVNAQTHEMKVFSNGELVRTLPITTGKEGFTTRSGTKVIIEKFDSKRMNSETVGIANDSAEGYDIDDVQYAMRLTYSGEFIHAAPWSVASQGNANVSHGCTGLSTANAQWLYQMTQIGDVVEYTGTDRPMTLDNGYGDWNETFQQYKQGSALA